MKTALALRYAMVTIATSLIMGGTMVACGQANFGNGTVQSKQKASGSLDAHPEAETPPPSEAGSDAPPPAGPTPVIDNASGKPEAPKTDAKAGAPKAIADANSGGFKPGQVITDVGTLERCKMDIYNKTHDLSLCLNCFAKWVAGGNRITADACGCVQKPGDLNKFLPGIGSAVATSVQTSTAAYSSATATDTTQTAVTTATDTSTSTSVWP